MRLLHLELDNFMGYVGHHELALENLGLVHIAGVNADDPANDSNGSGKSTLLEAITWALWGEGLPRRQGNAEKGVAADEVLSTGAPKQCRVTVSLMDEDTENTYQVARWRKWKDGKGKATSGASLAINGEVQEALDTAETNKWIRDCLGIDRDIWTRSVVFGQESQFNFCEATTGERSAILTTVMGLEAADRWLGRCRDERTQLRKDIAGTEGGLEVQRRQLATAEAQDPQARADQWEAERADRVEYFRKGRLQKEEEGKAAKAELERFNLARPAALTQEEPRRYNMSEEIRQAALDADKAWREMGGIFGGHQATHQAALRALSAAQGVTAGAICPTCKQAVTEAHRAACVEEAQAQVNIAQDYLDGAKAEQEQLQARVLETSAAQAEEVAKERASVDAALDYSRAIEVARAERGQLEARLNCARMDWKQCATREKEVAEEVNPHLAAVAEHKAQLQDLRDGLLHLEAEHTEQLQTLSVLDFWDREIPVFKTWMFDSIVDSLAAEANRWLRVMSAGVIWIQITTQKEVGRGSNKRLKDELEVTVHRWNPEGPPTVRPYRLWSGGEKRRVALAVDLGLSRLMAGRASKPYRYLAMDEVDRHLDERGREGLRAVLDELRAERETCMVITHDPEFRASFDTEILVTKQGGGSSWEVKRDERSTPQAEAEAV